MSNAHDDPGISEAAMDAFLKDEGLLEEGMDRKQKIEVYKILEISRHTAYMEENRRRGAGIRYESSSRGDHDILYQGSRQESFKPSMGSCSSPQHSQASLQQHHQQQEGHSHHYSHRHHHQPQQQPQQSPRQYHRQQHQQQQESHQASQTQEPPVRARRKKALNNHSKQDSLPTPVVELQLNADDELIPPELIDPRLKAGRETSGESNGFNPKLVLFLKQDEDQNRGMARIDEALKMSHQCFYTNTTETEHAV